VFTVLTAFSVEHDEHSLIGRRRSLPGPLRTPSTLSVVLYRMRGNFGPVQRGRHKGVLFGVIYPRVIARKLPCLVYVIGSPSPYVGKSRSLICHCTYIFSSFMSVHVKPFKLRLFALLDNRDTRTSHIQPP